MVSSTNKVNQKNVKYFSQVRYDRYAKKSWNIIRNLNNKVISIFKSEPKKLQHPNRSSILPSQVWTHDSFSFKLR